MCSLLRLIDAPFSDRSQAQEQDVSEFQSMAVSFSVSVCLIDVFFRLGGDAGTWRNTSGVRNGVRSADRPFPFVPDTFEGGEPGECCTYLCFLFLSLLSH